MPALAEELCRRGQQAGLAAVGIAPATPMEATRRVIEERKAAGLSGGMQFTYRNPARSTDPGRILAGAAALVVGAWPYGQGLRPRPEAGSAPCRPLGLVARYARYDYYQDLRRALGRLAEVLQADGWRARVVADDNALVDRAAAERAGLGWFGKNSNILLPGAGSWFLLGSVVTDAPLPTAAPVGDGCGSCRRCLSACPTGALVGPGVLDARRCLAWLLQATGVFPFEFRVALEGRIYGCDDCQEVCPANRLVARMDRSDDRQSSNGAQDETAIGADGQDGEAGVDLLELLSATDESLLNHHGRWYIPERDPRYLRRNALVALGNIAHGTQPEVGATLAHYLDHPDELLRAHAIWAAFRSGRRDLVASRPHLWRDPSPVVRNELERQPDVPERPRSGRH
jgi:epoxyqueuosine reductase